jgi:NADPH:quinone reductase-like Zn-dependent oxidoreductase
VVIQGKRRASPPGLHFAHAAGYRTIVTSSSEEKLERERHLGADVLRAMTQHRIRSVIDRVEHWTDARRAIDEMA